MASYVVLEPPRKAETKDGFVVVRDGFRVLAFIAPFLWFLWYRMWIEAALALGLGLLIAGIGELAGKQDLMTGLTLLVQIFVGLEAANLRVAMLRRRGWREWGLVEAANRDEAETRYLAERDEPGEYSTPTPWPPAAPPAAPTGGPTGGQKPAGPALGLLGYPN